MSLVRHCLRPGVLGKTCSGILNSNYTNSYQQKIDATKVSCVLRQKARADKLVIYRSKNSRKNDSKKQSAK